MTVQNLKFSHTGATQKKKLKTEKGGFVNIIEILDHMTSLVCFFIIETDRIKSSFHLIRSLSLNFHFSLILIVDSKLKTWNTTERKILHVLLFSVHVFEQKNEIINNKNFSCQLTSFTKRTCQWKLNKKQVRNQVWEPPYLLSLSFFLLVGSFFVRLLFCVTTLPSVSFTSIKYSL